jgi:hypothetical protein
MEQNSAIGIVLWTSMTFWIYTFVPAGEGVLPTPNTRHLAFKQILHGWTDFIQIIVDHGMNTWTF